MGKWIVCYEHKAVALETKEIDPQRVEQGFTLQDVFADLNATGKSLDRLRRDIEKGIDIFS